VSKEVLLSEDGTALTLSPALLPSEVGRFLHEKGPASAPGLGPSDYRHRSALARTD